MHAEVDAAARSLVRGQGPSCREQWKGEWRVRDFEDFEMSPQGLAKVALDALAPKSIHLQNQGQCRSSSIAKAVERQSRVEG